MPRKKTNVSKNDTVIVKKVKPTNAWIWSKPLWQKKKWKGYCQLKAPPTLIRDN